MANWKLIPIDVEKVRGYPNLGGDFLISQIFGDPRVIGNQSSLLVPERPISPIPRSPTKKEDKAIQTSFSRVSRGTQTSSSSTKEIATSTEEIKHRRSSHKSPRISRTNRDERTRRRLY
jgi:hypothetical protein